MCVYIYLYIGGYEAGGGSARYREPEGWKWGESCRSGIALGCFKARRAGWEFLSPGDRFMIRNKNGVFKSVNQSRSLTV